MNRLYTSVSQNETALSSWIIWVAFQNLSLRESFLNFYDIEIFLQPLLLSMNTEFILPLPDQLPDLVDVHHSCAASGAWPDHLILTPFLILAHEAAVASDIGAEDGGELALHTFFVA